MRSCSAIGIDNDFASGQAGIAMWSADDKASGRVDMKLCVCIYQGSRDDNLDDMFNDVMFNDLLP